MPLFAIFSLSIVEIRAKKEGGKHVLRASLPPKLSAVIPSRLKSSAVHASFQCPAACLDSSRTPPPAAPSPCRK